MLSLCARLESALVLNLGRSFATGASATPGSGSTSRVPGVRSVSAYTEFVRANFKSIAAGVSDKGVKPVVSVLAERWRNTSDAEKQRYAKIAEETRIKRLAEFRALPKAEQEKIAAETAERRVRRQKLRVRRERRQLYAKLGRPRPPTSSFMLYCLQRRNEAKEGGKPLATGNVAAVTKALGAEWRALPDTQKAPFQARANQQRSIYQRQIEAWTAANADKVTATLKKKAVQKKTAIAAAAKTKLETATKKLKKTVSASSSKATTMPKKKKTTTVAETPKKK